MQRRWGCAAWPAITHSAQSFMTAFPDIVVKMDRLVVKGSETEYPRTLTGTNTGPGGTGKYVKISGFEEWRFGADGPIAESLGHFDAADYWGNKTAPLVTKNFSNIAGPKRSSWALNLPIGSEPPSTCG